LVQSAKSTSSLEFAITEIKRHKMGVTLASVLVIAVLIGATFGIYKAIRRSQTPLPAAPPKLTLLTSTPALEREVAFSPDGKQIAFGWRGETDDNYDVYVKLIGVGKPLRLTTNLARDMSPAWSPDGRYIAFLRADGEGKGYYLIPALGGAERKLTDAYGWAQRGVMNQSVGWAPDGRTLAIVDKTAENEPWCIYLLSVETGERRKLTTPSTRDDGDTKLAFSPDGQTLVFVRSHQLVGDVYVSPGDLYVVPVAGGDPVRVTSDGAEIYGVAWTPDGTEIVFSSDRAGPSEYPTLWRIPAKGGSPSPVVGVGDNTFDVSISAQGNRLAFSRMSYDTNIYRVAMSVDSSGHRTTQPPTSLISSTQADTDPQFSPDARKIAFISSRSGDPNLWVCDADGKNAAQLTVGLNLNTPNWSPDGRLIAFDAIIGGNDDIYVVSADGGSPRRLTTELSSEATPSWSPDGSWLYFSSNRTGRAEVWKMPTAGGTAVQLTRGGGFNPVAALDGTVYYLRGDKQPWLWEMSTDGRETQSIDQNPQEVKWMEPANWAVVKSGIYFLEDKLRFQYTLKFFDFATRRTTTVMTLGDASSSFLVVGLTVARDERSILYSQRDKLDFDLVLGENFH